MRIFFLWNILVILTNLGRIYAINILEINSIKNYFNSTENFEDLENILISGQMV